MLISVGQEFYCYLSQNVRPFGTSPSAPDSVYAPLLTNRHFYDSLPFKLSLL